MFDRPFNLAIETSSRIASVALGRDDESIGEAILQPHDCGGGSTDLMPTIQQLCAQHGVCAAQLGEVYLSIGPGSFTGLRIGVTTAKMLARVLGAKVVAVPTLNVVAQNAPADATYTAVCLNRKRGTVYAGVFERTGDGWLPNSDPHLCTIEQLLSTAPRPLALLGDPLPPLPDDLDPRVTVLPAELATPHADALWRLGRNEARHGRFAEPTNLLPLYVRPPEAVELWNKRLRDKAATDP